jgi:hypothetical protein
MIIIIKIIIFCLAPLVFSETIELQSISEISKVVEKHSNDIIICSTGIFFDTIPYKKSEYKKKEKKKEIKIKKSEYKNIILNFLTKYEHFYLIHTGLSLDENISNLSNNKENLIYLFIKKGKNNPFIIDKIILDSLIRHEVIIYFLILHKKINMKNKKIIYITYSKQIFKSISNEEIVWVLMKNKKKEQNNNNK